MKKAMSDGEVNDYVANKMMGDLDGIEAHGMFDEHEPEAHPNEGTKVEAHGVSVHIKPMNGEQTQDMPAIKDANPEDDELGELGL